jgi:hypothetical protein
MAGKADEGSELDSWVASQLRTGIAGWKPGPQGFEQVLTAKRRRVELLRRNVLAGGLALMAFGLLFYTLVPSPAGTMRNLVAVVQGGIDGNQATPIAVVPPPATVPQTSPTPDTVPPTSHWHHLKRDPATASETIAKPADGKNQAGDSSSSVVAGPRASASASAQSTACAWGVVCQSGQATPNASMTPQQMQQLAAAWAASRQGREDTTH